MRSPDPEIMNQVAEYIRDFQIENGRSPEQQEVAKGLRINHSKAWRYVHHLEEAGRIDFDKSGGIEMNYLFDSAPERCALLGEVRCGEPTTAVEDFEGVYEIPEIFLGGGGKHFILRANGYSMNLAGIQPDDFLVIREQPDADIGRIVVAMRNVAAEEGEATLKRLIEKNGRRYLHSESDVEKIKDMPVAEFRIIGVLVGHYHFD